MTPSSRAGRSRAAAALAGLVLAAGTSSADPSIEPGMPPEVRSLREQILSPAEYAELAARWRGWAAEHPGSAVARVMESRAMRYAGEGTTAERVALLREAWHIDPACPEALEALAATCLGEGELSPDEARALALEAVERAPGWPRPHFTLWALAAAAGDQEEAARQARALVETGGLPSPLLDFGHNMLVSAEEGGIIFTNGDNDTYPPLALQARWGERPDVRVVNLSLLNIAEYAVATLADGPLTADAIRDEHAAGKAGAPPRDPMLADRLLARVLEAVRQGSCRRPVYLAVTVNDAHTRSTRPRLRLEGILWRVLPGPAANDGGDPPVALDRTLALLRNDFRLDSATDRAFAWERAGAVRNLMQNYPAALRLVATRAAEQGDLAGVRLALGRAARILRFHGQDDTLEQVMAYWNEIDPDRPGRAP